MADLKFKQWYKNNDLARLKIRMDEIPVSLAIAQAAKETDGGVQDLHKKEMHYLAADLVREGIRPLNIEKDENIVAKFKILKASVRVTKKS